MRFKRSKATKAARGIIDMTPLINVVFLLILYFMFSSTFVVQASIPIEMPKAGGINKIDQNDVTITLLYSEDGVPRGPDGRGEVYFNEDPVPDMNTLATRLQAVVDADPESIVLIRPDARLDTGRFVEVMGIANSVGVRRYGIAAVSNTSAGGPVSGVEGVPEATPRLDEAAAPANSSDTTAPDSSSGAP
jgi:biopolymer transport protein ExbD